MYFSANHAVRTEATAVLDERATLWGAHTFNEDSHLASSTFVRGTSTLAVSGPHAQHSVAVWPCGAEGYSCLNE